MVMVSIVPDERVKRGDIAVLKGTLESGFGQFVATMRRASVVEVRRITPGDVGRVVRDWFDGVRRVVPDPQASWVSVS